MNIHATSSFKNPSSDHRWYKDWIARVEKINRTSYPSLELKTSLGKTIIWTINAGQKELPALVIFPGFRTVPLFWDFDRNLDVLRNDFRLFLVDTNGQPCLSDGNTPDIKSNDYGVWASEVLDQLSLPSAFVAGASFGGLVCMKLAIVAPEKVKKAILLNPGCLQTFSFGMSNMYYNMLPILFPSKKNVAKFLDNAVFCKPHHKLSPASEELIVDYELFALTQFIDKGQKPYFMKEELLNVTSETYLIEGTKDLLFPYQQSIANAKKYIRNLKEVFVLENTAHGIETSGEAMTIIRDLLLKN